MGFSHCSKMIRIGLLIALVFVGSSAKYLQHQSRQDFTEEDAKAVLNMVFCACDEADYDGVLSLDEFTSEVCEVVNNHLFGYQVNEDDFEKLDTNNDGHISTEEVFDAFNAMANPKAMRLFSNNEYIEAGFVFWAVHVTAMKA